MVGEGPKRPDVRTRISYTWYASPVDATTQGNKRAAYPSRDDASGCAEEDQKHGWHRGVQLRHGDGVGLLGGNGRRAKYRLLIGQYWMESGMHPCAWSSIKSDPVPPPLLPPAYPFFLPLPPRITLRSIKNRNPPRFPSHFGQENPLGYLALDLDHLAHHHSPFSSPLTYLSPRLR